MSKPVTASSGIVASSQRLASEIGVQLLKAGGSAVDAAIAVNAMLNLIEPYMCGLGGDLFAQVWDPAVKRLHGLNASGRAPEGQSLIRLQEQLGTAETIPGIGVHAITVPGAVAGWAALHERYGRLPLADLFAPVIEYAERGVEIGPVTANWWSHCIEMALVGELAGSAGDSLRNTFLVDGSSPASGTTFRNPALGAAYRRLAENGFDDFYRGDLSAETCRYLAQQGSSLTRSDFSSCAAEWVDPISSLYRGYEVFELPPNGQGLSVLQMLNILEHFPLSDYHSASVEYWHWFIEAKKLAFEDRARYYADPQFVDVPIARLASKTYASERLGLITEQANRSPSHGDAGLSQGDTTYLSVADSNGMMVSLIQSIFSGFGSGLVPPGLGFAMQSRGAGFSLKPDHPNVYAPGKRPFHTIMPAFVMRDGQPLMSLGVMGADMQPQGQVQVLVNMIDFGLDPQAAGDARRLRHDGRNSPSHSQSSDAGVVWYEDGMDSGLIAALTARGHELRAASHPVLHFMGGYQNVLRENSGYSAASETRFDGCALGY